MNNRSKITVNDNNIRIEMIGRISVDAAKFLKETVLFYCNNHYQTYYLDFSEVTYIDSSGLGTLVALYKQVKKINGKIIIENMNGVVEQLLNLPN